MVQTMQGPPKCLSKVTEQRSKVSAYADLARSAHRPCQVACLCGIAHAFTTAAVDVAQGLGADLAWSQRMRKK
jgi:hypothetical protein